MAQFASVQAEDPRAQVRCGMVERVAGRVLGIGPHADAIPWPGPPAGSITQPAEPGSFEYADSFHVVFLHRHALFGIGQPGYSNVGKLR